MSAADIAQSGAPAPTTASAKKARRRKVVPLHERAAVTYEEAERLGFGCERVLRQLVASGKVRRSVLRVGRSVRFLRAALIEELQELSNGS